MFKKMRNRLLAVNMVILTLVMITSFTVIYVITYSGVMRENKQNLNAIPSANITGNEIINPNPDAPIVEEKHYDTLLGGGAVLPVDYANSFSLQIDDNGEISAIYSHIKLSEEVYGQAAALWGKSSEGTITLEGRKWQYKASTQSKIQTTHNEKGEAVTTEETVNQIAFLDITESMKNLKNLLITFLIAGVSMLFVLFAVSFAFASRSIKPIESMWNKQVQFVTDASHELKTPLFAIKSNLSVVRTSPDETVKSQEKWLTHADSAIGRMDKLINNLLYLATAETVKEITVPFNLSIMTENAISTVEAVAYEKGLKLIYSLTPEAIVSGDEDKLKQVVFILLDNAVKYTNKGGVIEVSVENTKHHVRLKVSNTGKPIPKEDLTKIFDRFYRADKSRSGETEGYGLGLSIAKAIVERNEGEIKAESSEDKTIFTVLLKRHI